MGRCGVSDVEAARSRLDRVQAALGHVEALTAWEGDARVTWDLAVAETALRRIEHRLSIYLAACEYERACETVTPEAA